MNKNKTILVVLQIGKNQEYARPLFPAMFFTSEWLVLFDGIPPVI